jgi:hypothetical protein
MYAEDPIFEHLADSGLIDVVDSDQLPLWHVCL